MSEAQMLETTVIGNNTCVPVLLFDGDCAFCNNYVRWLLKYERRTRFYFASLQSTVAAPLLIAYGIAPGDLSSLVVIDRGMFYRKSSAILHLLQEMRWPWRLLGVFALIPRGARDVVYDYIGARRYRWWGRAESCVIADAGLGVRIFQSVDIQGAG